MLDALPHATKSLFTIGAVTFLCVVFIAQAHDDERLSVHGRLRDEAVWCWDAYQAAARRSSFSWSICCEEAGEDVRYECSYAKPEEVPMESRRLQETRSASAYEAF